MPTVNHQVVINYHTNYSLFAYPLQVIATNRMVDSIISRRKEKMSFPGLKLLKDVKDIYAVGGGMRALYRGFLPYFASTIINDINLESRPPSKLIF